VNKEVASEIIYEDDDLMAFQDISPQAPVHILLVSKKHIEKLTNLGVGDHQLAGRIIIAANEIAKKLNVDESGFRLVINCNKDGGQEVFHLHTHIIGGQPLGGMC
jgi:histidine triad (HIT) family protein